MKTFQLKNVLLISAVLSALAGCGGGGGAPSAAAPAPAPAPAEDTSGQVINSYITGATVTLDANDDGICAATEPTVTTGANGSYRFTATGAHLVCATGGTNTVTGLPFVGRLTAPPRATVVTPLTTLIVAQVMSKLPAPALNKAAPLDAAAVAAAQTTIMSQLSLPASAPVLSTDPVALMTKAGATAADAKLEQNNAAVQVMLQQVATSIIGSANLPAAANATATNEAFAAAVTGLQTALTASGAGTVDLTTATTASTGKLINAMAIKAAATAKASQVLLGVSANFGLMSSTSVAAAIAASPVPDLVNAVASASTASLTTQGGAETVALASTHVPDLMKQLSSLLTDNADAGSVSVATLTNLMTTLLPSTGIPATQTAADSAIANAINIINGALPAGRPAIVKPPVVVPPGVTIPKK